MKKHFAFILCLIIMISLISCGTNDQNVQETTATAEAESLTNDVAMQMYQAAIRDEISVYDEHFGEVKLKDLRFTENGTALGACNLLKKAILDIDQDGVNEFIIQSTNYEHIILRYFHGKVYSYRWDTADYYEFNTDGTFYWYDSFESDGWKCGLNKIVFDKETIRQEPVYSLTYTNHPAKYEYFVQGKSVTSDQYYEHRTHNTHKQSAEFSQFELACSYPVTAQNAWDLANAYWDFQDGCAESSAGTTWTARLALIDTPNSDTNYYRVAFQVEWSSGGALEGYECMPPYAIHKHDQILVNAFTGEIVASTYDPNGKVVTVEQAIEIAKNDCDYIDFDHEGNEYCALHDTQATAPDHIYVIVIQKYMVDHYSDYTVRWVDKNTGEIIAPYYLNGK